VEVKLPNLKKVTFIFFAIMFAEGNLRSFYGLLRGEPLLKEYEFIRRIVMLPNWSRKWVMWVWNLLGERRAAELVSVFGENKALELLGWNRIRRCCCVGTRVLSCLWRISWMG